MGTSTPWSGPRGRKWATARLQLTLCAKADAKASRRDAAAKSQLNALHQTVRANPRAYGLYDAACAGGERLIATLTSLAATETDPADPPGPQGDTATLPVDSGTGLEGAGQRLAALPPEELFTRLADDVGGTGGTLLDAALRRAAVRVGREIRDREGELAAEEDGSSFAEGLLAFVLWLFCAGLVGEFLAASVNESPSLATSQGSFQTEEIDPELYEEQDPQTAVTNRVIATTLRHLTASTDHRGVAGRIDGTGRGRASGAPATGRSAVPSDLVVRTVRIALGLPPEDQEDEAE